MPKNTVPRSRRASAPKTPTIKSTAVEPINGDQESIEAAQARIAATLDLKGLCDRERAFLATCQRIYRRHSGFTSPFEEFFWTLVFNVENGYWPTPDDVADELKTFTQNFEDMREWAAQFNETYPKKPATVAAHA